MTLLQLVAMTLYLTEPEIGTISYNIYIFVT